MCNFNTQYWYVIGLLISLARYSSNRVSRVLNFDSIYQFKEYDLYLLNFVYTYTLVWTKFYVLFTQFVLNIKCVSLFCTVQLRLHLFWFNKLHRYWESVLFITWIFCAQTVYKLQSNIYKQITNIDQNWTIKHVYNICCQMNPIFQLFNFIPGPCLGVQLVFHAHVCVNVYQILASA